jgi:hypothetical protein
MVGGCSVVSGPAAELPTIGPYVGRPGPDGGTLLAPASARVSHGVAFAFSLGHCGLFSPVDVDGAFWDAQDSTDARGRPLDLATDGEMINATPGTIVIDGDQLTLRTDGGAVVRFSRHVGEREFPGCD